jgi:hypothetical protein
VACGRRASTSGHWEHDRSHSCLSHMLQLSISSLTPLQVARIVTVSDHDSPLIARAGDLAGELALAAAAAQQLQSITFVVGRSHLT